MLRSVLLAALIFASPSLAHAQRSRVLLVAVDDTLFAATQSALAPWDVDVTRADGETPASMPLASELGASLARAHDVTAVVWISSGEGGTALWVYDATTERTLSRALTSSPPFDEPTCAAIALTLKTLLRHSAAAPVAERAVEPTPPRPRLFELEIGGGLLAFHTDPADVEPRISLAASFWPAQLAGILGIALTARAGPGLGVHATAAEGRWTSTQIVAGLRARADLAPFDLGAALEVGVGVSTLHVVLAHEEGVSLVRAAFAGALWGEVGARPSSDVRIALRAGATFALPYERYLQRGALVLDVSPVAMLAELLLALCFG